MHTPTVVGGGLLLLAVMLAVGRWIGGGAAVIITRLVEDVVNPVTTRNFTALLVCAALSAAADAAVVQVAANGFAVRHEATVNAPPAKVYEALTQVGSWWSPDHTYSGDATNLSIEARAGGCFCERLKDAGSVEHLRVVFVTPGRALRMTGGLGPLQSLGVAGSMTWRLAPADAGTKLEVAYNVGGFVEGGFDKLAAAVDSVLGEQFQRLKIFAETGKPTISR